MRRPNMAINPHEIASIHHLGVISAWCPASSTRYPHTQGEEASMPTTTQHRMRIDCSVSRLTVVAGLYLIFTLIVAVTA